MQKSRWRERDASRKVETGRDRVGDRVCFESQGETQRNCTRGRTRSRDRWTGSMGRQMSPCLFLPCFPGLLISWAHTTPPTTRSPSLTPTAAAAEAVTIKLIPLWPRHPPLLSLFPSFPAIISLVQNEPQRLEPDSCSILEPVLGSLGTVGGRGEGHRVEGRKSYHCHSPEERWGWAQV